MKKHFASILRVCMIVVLLAGTFIQPQLAEASAIVNTDAMKPVTTIENLSHGPSLAAPGPEPSSDGYTVVSQETFAEKNSTSVYFQGPVTVGEGAPNNSGSQSPLFSWAGSAPASTYGFSGGLEIEPITAYNLIVDSNVLAPSSYGPNSATLGAKFCNTSGSTMTDVWAYIGSYNGGSGSTPGVYPINSPATNTNFNTDFPQLVGTISAVDYGDPTRFLALEQESGTTTDADDASRYLGTLAAGECRTVYWLVSYPRVATVDGSPVDVTGGVKPDDDLWLQYDFWATSGANTSYYTRYVTMRNEISAMANKIWPNGDNKVPDEYVNAIQQVLGWDTWTPNGSGTTAYPGETVTSQGIWYDLGNVGAGFDNNYDFVPDRNFWLQPIGDAGSYDPGCFRLVRTYGLIIVKLNDGTDMLIPFVDQMYFENIPDNNNGAVGLVFYEYIALDGACTAGLTPYQEVASGYDNEKFNADFGAGIPPLQSQETNMLFDKTDAPTAVNPNAQITYTLSYTNVDPDGAGGMTVTVGDPGAGMPFTIEDKIPADTCYVIGSAVANTGANLLVNGAYSPSSYTVLYSSDTDPSDGIVWQTTEPTDPVPGTATCNEAVTYVRWLRTDEVANGSTGQVQFKVLVPSNYTTSTGKVTVENTGCIKLGEGPCFKEDKTITAVTGNGSINGTVWKDDSVTGGVLANGIQDGTEAGIPNVTVYLYWDNNGDGDYADAGDFLYATTTSMNYAIIDGYVDVDGDATTGGDTGDDASNLAGGVNIIDGRVDVNGDGVVDTTDDGFFGGYPVIDGLIDVNGGGVDATDDGTLVGVYNFGRLPATDTTTPQYILVVETTDTDIPTGYGPTTVISYKNIEIGTTTTTQNYGDGTTELTDFGFAPPLSLDKNLITTAPVVVGDTIQYTITLMNRMPGDGTNNNACTYRVWGTGVNAQGGNPPGGGNNTNSQFVAPTTAILGPPDSIGTSSNMRNNPDTIGVYGFTLGSNGQTITSVKILTYVRETINMQGADAFYVRPWNITTNAQLGQFTYLGNDTTYFNNGLYSGAIVTDVTSLRAWTFSDFDSNKFGVSYEANGNPPSSAGDISIDAVAYEITTNGTCGGASATLNPVPLTDTFNSAYYSFISSTPPVSSSGAGTLTWNNVGPIYPGGIKVITVNLRALQTGTTPNTVNTATSTGSKFANGLPANSPVTDTAYATIGANTATRSLSGRVFDDNNTNGWQAAAWSEPGTAQTGYDTGDTGIGYIPVDLYVCLNSSGVPVTNAGNNRTCAQESGTWQYLRATSTSAYNIVGSLVDVNGDGVVNTSDNGTIGGCTITNGSVSGCTTFGNFPVVGSGVDINRDGVANASDNILVGGYFFSNLRQGYYYVKVHNEYIVGAQTADVDQNGTCTSCDSQSNGPGVNLEPGTFPGDLNAVSNTALTNVSFGYNVASGTYNIGDFLFYDWNGNGAQDASDEPMSGITVQLLAPDGTVIATTTTNSSGIYAFNGYPVGYYTIRVLASSLPSGVTQSYDPDSTKDGQSSFNLTANDLTRDFGYQPVGSGTIGDTVFKDINGNGTQGNTEPGISGVTVELQVDLNSDGTWVTIATDVTDSSGNYLFTGLPAGTYRVKIDLDNSPYPNSTAIPNDLFGNDYLPSNGATSTAGQVYMARTLATNTSSDLTADFGFAPPASFGDTVYQDINNNGTQDFNEPGINGVTVNLYTFTDLGDGDGVYDVGEPFYDENGNSTWDVGEPFFDRDGRYQPGDTLGALVATTTTATVNSAAGKYLFTGLAPGYYVAVVDTSSAPLVGATLTGDPATDGVSCTTLTALSSPPSSVCDSRDGTRLYNATNYTGADFGYLLPGAIGDTLWIDTNNDGIRDLTEAGIANVTVYLCDSSDTLPCNAGNANATTVTDANGNYSFTGLSNNTYYVAVDTTDTDLTSLGLTQTYETNSGTPDNTTTVVVNSSGVVTDINGTSCTNCNLNIDFGYRYQGNTTLSGTVCLETTVDGVCGDSTTDTSGVGSGETAYNNVTVFLYKLVDSNSNGQYDTGESVTLVATTVTNSNGDYAFTNIVDGVYYIVAIGAPQSGLDLTSNQGTVNSGGDDASTTQYVETTAFDGSTLSAYQVVNTAGDTDVTDRDFAFNIDGAYDFGDLLNSYSTTLAGNPDGARHEVPATPNLYFGSDTTPPTQADLVEADGQPTTGATGDGADEDGVSIASTGVHDNADGWADNVGTLQFDIVGSGWLVAWVDANNDGDFSDAGEMIINQAVSSGQDQNIDFSTATLVNKVDGTYSFRFRLFPSQPAIPTLAYSGAATNGEVEDYKFTVSGGITTPVTLSYFYAKRQGSAINFEWSTATETDNMGFNLFVEQKDGNLKQINAELIPSGVIDSLDRQDYVYSISMAGNVFYIEDVSLQGETRLHGPFHLGKNFGLRYETENENTRSIRLEHLKKFAAQQKALRAQMQLPAAARYSPIFTSLSRFYPKGYLDVTLALKVRETGIYHVTYEELQAAGLDLKGVPISKIALANRGEQVPLTVQGPRVNRFTNVNGKFGPGYYIEFYGEALDTTYTDTNVYILQVNRSVSQRISTSTATPTRKAVSPQTFTETVTLNKQLAYANSTPGEDPWYDTVMYTTKTPKSWEFPFQVVGLADTTAPAEIHLSLFTQTNMPQDPDHHFIASINGIQLADEYFDGTQEKVLNLSLPANTLHEGENKLQITLPGDTGASMDVVYFDQLHVNYQRSFSAVDGKLAFTAADKVFTVTNLPDQNVVVYRVDSKGITQISKLTLKKSGNTYSVTFAGSGIPATYYVAVTGALQKPTFEATRLVTDLNQPAQYLIIAHPDFIDGLQPLVDARRAQGLTVSVVDVNDLYAQYGYGIFDPQAIKDYIAHAVRDLGTEYVLLVGGDTYDYRNYTGKNSISFIPSLYATTGEVAKFVPVDPLYTDIDNDNVPDAAIGRFPVRTTEELALMVNKTLTYQSKDYSHTAIFVSDTYDNKGISFKQISEAISGGLPSSWATTNIHLDDISMSTAHTQLIAAMNNGSALVTYTGHSGPVDWTSGGLFTTKDATALANNGRPFVVVQWGCWNTYYVNPSKIYLVQSFLFSGDQGAAAVFGASTLTDSESEQMLGELLMPRLTVPGMPMGKALTQAKAELAQTHPELLDVLLGWTLMGDPALVVEP